MEEHGPFCGSINCSTPAINIPQHPATVKANHHQKYDRYSESNWGNGSKLASPSMSLRAGKTNEESSTNDGLNECVSINSSYGSCSSGSSDQTEGALPFSLKASHAIPLPSYKGDKAKTRIKENEKQDQSYFDEADLGETTPNVKSTFRSGVPRPRDKCKVDSKGQQQCSIRSGKTKENGGGRKKDIWKKITGPKKKNKIGEAVYPSDLIEECDEVRAIVTNNYQKIMKRQENLEDLENRSEQLKEKCEQFFKHTRDIKEKHSSCWSRMCNALKRCCCCFCCCGRSKRQSLSHMGAHNNKRRISSTPPTRPLPCH